MTRIDDKALQAQTLAVRLFAASLGAAELMTAYLGMCLGLYHVLATRGPATAPQLAERAGIAPRYAREWLEQQAVSGIVDVDDVTKAPEDRLYVLPPGHSEALIQPDSLFYIAPLALLPVGGLARMLPRLLDVYRTGGGIPYAEYGADFRGGHAGLNRGIFLHRLAHWIETSLPDVHVRLVAGGVRVADIGCGVGWSSIALARAYPDVRVDGFDPDESSLGDARRHAAEAGVADRVTFEVQGAGAPTLAGKYALVCIFDALHDMARPVDVLRTCRSLLAKDGSVLLMEPNVAETFTAPASETERFMYAVSLLHCLPVGLSEQPSAGTGTVMRPDTLRAYATEAGFIDVKVVPVKNQFYRLYHLLG